MQDKHDSRLIANVNLLRDQTVSSSTLCKEFHNNRFSGEVRWFKSPPRYTRNAQDSGIYRAVEKNIFTAVSASEENYLWYLAKESCCPDACVHRGQISAGKVNCNTYKDILSDPDQNTWLKMDG